MKAVVYKGKESISLEEKPKPKAGAGEAVVKVKYCGLCGTDLHSYLEGGIIEPGTVLGHEIVGTVDELGSGVEGWSVGDRVAVGPPGHCPEMCYQCRQGRPNICQHGFGRTAGISPNTDGGYAEYVKVSYPAHMLLKIPDNVSFEEAVLFDILGVPFHGIRRSDFSVGDKAVVLGAGAIGLSAVLFLKMGGAGHITVVDPISKKRELALKFGADLALDPKKEGDGLAGKIVELYDGIGADVAYECAGYPDAISSAANVTKSGGQTVIMGTSPEQIPLASAHLCPREVDLLTSFVYTEDEIKMILALMENRKLDTEGMVTDTINLEDVEEKGFKKLAAAEDQVKILIKP